MGDSVSERTAASAELIQMLDVLACPACLQSLQYAGAALVCTGCGRRYPVQDGIAILLIDRATGAE